MGVDPKGALEAIEEAFGDRLRQETPREGLPRDGALPSVCPRNVE